MLALLQPTLRNNLWKMYAIRLFYWMHFMASVLIPFLRDWGGISFTRIFVLNAWFMFCNFLLEVPTGTVADVFGRKISLVAGSLVAVAGWIVYTSVADFRVFLIGETLIAASMTLMSGADDALVYDSLAQLGEGAAAKRIFARLESFKLAGIITGALSGGFIASRFGLRAPMLLQTVPSGVAALLALSLVEPGKAQVERRLADYGQVLRAGMRHFRGHPVLRVLAFDMILTATLSWLIIWLYQPQLERAGLSIAFFGVVHAGMCIGQILLLSNIERFESWLGSRRRYFFLSALLPGVAYVVLGLTSRPIFVVGAVLLAASFGLSRPPLFASAMNRHIPSEQRATVLSTISMLRTLAVAVVNPIVGWLVDWSMSGALLVVGAAALALATVTRLEEGHLID